MSMSKRSPPATPPAVLTNTAESPWASDEGKRTRNEPDSCSCRRRVTPSTRATSNATAPTARLDAKIWDAVVIPALSSPSSFRDAPPNSALPEFGISLSKSATADLDAQARIDNPARGYGFRARAEDGAPRNDRVCILTAPWRG